MLTREVHGGLVIQTTSQVATLTKGQRQLLKVIRDCAQNNKSLGFDKIVLIYYENVRKTFSIGQGWYYPSGSSQTSYGRYKEYIEYDILECWHNQEKLYHFKSKVRQWFVANIGVLVIKNQLVVIPTIEIE